MDFVISRCESFLTAAFLMPWAGNYELFVKKTKYT